MKLFIGSLGLLLGTMGIASLLLWFGKHDRRAVYHVCLECGRREWCVYDDRGLASSSLDDDDTFFWQRFGAAVPPTHAHDWMIDSGSYEEGGMTYTGNVARDWIEILPRLSDSTGAEAVFREAIALEPEPRHELIRSFVGGLRGCGGQYDEAFERWNAARRSR